MTLVFGLVSGLSCRVPHHYLVLDSVIFDVYSGKRSFSYRTFSNSTHTQNPLCKDIVKFFSVSSFDLLTSFITHLPFSHTPGTIDYFRVHGKLSTHTGNLYSGFHRSESTPRFSCLKPQLSESTRQIYTKR